MLADDGGQVVGVRHLDRHPAVERPLEKLLPELFGEERAPLDHGPHRDA